MNDAYPIPDFLRRKPEQPAGPREMPILFSPEMVRAILSGTKTQTRRHLYTMRKFFRTACFHRDYPPPPELTPVGQCWALSDWRRAKEGEKLWVREAWGTASIFDDVAPRDLPRFAPIKYYADGKIVGATAGYGLMLKARPSIHMPRRFSRILLEIESVRVERLQDISEADAKAEGVIEGAGDFAGCFSVPGTQAMSGTTAKECYARLWDDINGAGSWAANPFAWVISFRRITP